MVLGFTFHNSVSGVVIAKICQFYQKINISSCAINILRNMANG
jgi:hypothetical protein